MDAAAFSLHVVVASFNLHLPVTQRVLAVTPTQRFLIFITMSGSTPNFDCRTNGRKETVFGLSEAQRLEQQTSDFTQAAAQEATRPHSTMRLTQDATPSILQSQPTRCMANSSTKRTGPTPGKGRTVEKE